MARSAQIHDALTSPQAGGVPRASLRPMTRASPTCRKGQSGSHFLRTIALLDMRNHIQRRPRELSSKRA
jgi:hypothetical protein